MTKLEECIKRVLRKSGLTQVELSKKANFTQPTLSRWISGKQEPTHEKWNALRTVAEENGVMVPKLEDVMHSTAGFPASLTINGEIQPDGAYLNKPHKVSYQPDNSVFQPHVVHITGSKYFPVFEDGDFIGFDKVSRSPQDGVGHVCLVETDTKDTVIVRIFQDLGSDVFVTQNIATSETSRMSLKSARRLLFRLVQSTT